METEQWPEYMTVAEIAEILRVSKMTVYRLVNDGTLVSKRVGRSFRVRSSTLRAYLATEEGGTVDGTQDRP